MNRVLNNKSESGISLVMFLGFPMLFYITGMSMFSDLYHQTLLPLFIYFTIPFLMALLAVLALTPIMILAARRFKALDYPSLRKMQKRPIPLLGGLGIFLGFLLTSLFFRPWTTQMEGIIFGGGVLLIIGTLDDVYPLSSTTRLIAQLAASIIVISCGMKISFLPDTLIGDICSWSITLVWLLGITNAFNFADGIDGLASGIAIIASIFFFVITLSLGQYDVALVCIILAGCTIGFLVYNFKPAKIYLGDGGSTFLGFMLASIALYGWWSTKGFFVSLGVPVLILGVLIYDMCYITISRIKNGLIKNIREWLDFTGKDHFHHRLIHLGFKEEFAVMFICIICIVLGLSAVVLSKDQTSESVFLLIGQGALIFVNLTMLMLAGRKLYLPREVLQNVLPDSEVSKYDNNEYISGDMLKKILEGESSTPIDTDAAQVYISKIFEEINKRKYEGTD